VGRRFLDANILFPGAAARDCFNCGSVRLHRLSQPMHFFDASQRKFPRGVSLPEKNVPILLAAIEARSTHLLTGDVKHFGRFLGTKIEGIAIVLADEYLRARAT
jgi:hypothetical protein